MFGPDCAIRARTDWSKPRMSAVMPTIDVMPMTTPSTVSADRILLVRMVSTAMTTTSQRSARRRVIIRPSFPPEGFDGVQPRGAHRRIQPEEQSDRRGDVDAERNRPGLDRRRNRRERRNQRRDQSAEQRADDAAEYREHDRFGENLRQDVGSPRAERLAQPDLARPLGDDHQHDVHDHD